MIRRIFKQSALVVFAFLSALNYTVFVFPNSFAPSGLDGICTMIQNLSGVSMGYLALIANIPLVLAAFLILNREFAVNSTVYIISFSIGIVLLKKFDISDFYYITETSIILAPVAAGAIRGILYAVTLRLNGSSGGVDIVSALVKNKKPHLNLMNIIFFFNMLVALSSYFVYGMKPEPVICSIIYSFMSSTVSNKLRSGNNKTVKFEIITPDAQKLCREISDKLHQTATIMDAHGAFSGADMKMVVCVVAKEKAPYVENMILNYPDCVVFSSIVSRATEKTYLSV